MPELGKSPDQQHTRLGRTHALAHEVFIASSSASLPWARELQEAIAPRMPEVIFKVWDQDIFKPSSNAINDLLRTAKRSSAGIFLFSPDDNVTINGKEQTITRDNVIFEFGLFVGQLGLDRAVLITPEGADNFRLLSDANGVTTIRFSFKSHSDEDRQSALGPTVNKIEKKLKQALSSQPPLNIEAMTAVGLLSATSETDHSAFSYREAINAANTYFAVLGVGADKLTSNEEAFERMVKRIMASGGQVRLLLLDPDSYMVLQDQDESESKQIAESVARSLQRVAETIKRLKCGGYIKIRSYFAINHDHVPPFRITLIDDNQCIVSPRNLDGEDKSKLQPQLIFRSTASPIGSAYQGSFRRYFETLWRNANPETPQSMMQRIRALANKTSQIGCVHGRFQPPHKGHLNYIRDAKARCEVLYIGITQPDIESLAFCAADEHRSARGSNPLTFAERAECLRRMLSEHGYYERRHYIIIPFDIDVPDMLRNV